ncbi:MAG: DUF4159 domain-containing protein [Bdellovibrionales bacterium]
MSSFVFLNPWLLSALIGLPAVWFLLRIMPPAPKRVLLHSARFLDGLIPKRETPSKTPWWILLLRLLIVSFAIFAFAQPVLNPSHSVTGSKPLRLIIDDHWASGDQWESIIQEAQDILAQAERQDLSVYLHTTTPQAVDGKPLSLGPVVPSDALSRIKGLSPHSWERDLQALNQNLQNNPKDTDIYYFSSGINSRGMDNFLESLDTVIMFSPQEEDLPLLLSRGDDENGQASLIIRKIEGSSDNVPVTLQALGANARVLGIETVVLNGETTDITLDIPDVLRRDLTHVRLIERNDAGAVYLFGDQFQKKSVGIASPDDSDDRPFIEASFYLKRALEPYADLTISNLDALLSSSVSMIVLPDVAAFSPDQLNRLTRWVDEGGLLLRFAGPAMEQARQNFLLPTPTRQGARSLDGSLTWENPPKLSSFSDQSPLSGIAISDDIIIKQQILAEPASDLEEKTWASLDDGTPLITAAKQNAGLIVMVHTTASPDWSNLPLSGAFVQILNRLVKISGSSQSTLQDFDGTLDPIRTVDGLGYLEKPESHVQTIVSQDFDTTHISYQHPPGVYGKSNFQRALNLGDHIISLKAIDVRDANVQRQYYDAQYETNLMPYFLTIAFLLLCLDWIIMILISGRHQFLRLRHAGYSAVFVLALCMFHPTNVAAQETGDFKYADGFYLGFIKSNNASLNAQTRAGLEALKDALTRRTSAEPDGVAALDAETDELSFFPILYWPVDAADKPLSEQALRNIQNYLDHGGTILFDTREDIVSAELGRGGANTAALANMIAGLNVPALAPIHDEHVLGRSFYLLDTFPGRFLNGTIWVESNSVSGRDGVSSILIGSHDWGHAWQAYGIQNQGRIYRSGGSTRQRELSIRFGVNMVMYALTGNYKADQVHVKHILERLGQ